MNEFDKQKMRKSLSPEEVTHRYQQAITYFVDGAKTGIMDMSEYKIFQETLPKRDLSAAAHAWFNMIITWEEYFNLVQAIIAFDLMVSGVIDKSVQVKSNGNDDDKEVDVNGDLMGLTKDDE